MSNYKLSLDICSKCHRIIESWKGEDNVDFYFKWEQKHTTRHKSNLISYYPSGRTRTFNRIDSQ